MGIAQRARDSFGSIRNIWSHGEEEDFERHHGQEEEDEDAYSVRDEPAEAPRYESTPPSRGGGRGVGAVPLRVAYRRDKQIYTIRPHSLEEATSAADFLKSGSAVVVSLDDVDRSTAVRIIDFMSGVCYGLDAQGNAMKLGATIFLFTPGDFEIAASEAGYNKNPESFFRDVPSTLETTLGAAASAPAGSESQVIERTVVRVPAPDRVVVEGAARAAVERPVVPPPAWES